MTEAEWSACTDPEPMLEFLRGKVSDRKLRLFAVACCYRIRDLLTDEICREAIEVGVRLAEGDPLGVNLSEISSHLWNTGFSYIDGYKKERDLNIGYHAAFAAYHSLGAILQQNITSSEPNLLEVPAQVAWVVAHYRRWGDEDQPDMAALRNELTEQTPLLREFFGPLPFRPSTVHPRWLVWHDATIPKIAQSIYIDRAYDHLPILADALEDAGCDNADILAHCRGGGEHVRGCWVVDLILGKK